MKKRLKPDGGGEVDEIHDGRPCVHAYAADVFRNAVHKVARAVAFVKSGVELLVMTVYLVFLIVFDVAAHHDDGLPHEEHKESAAEKCQHQQGNAAGRISFTAKAECARYPGRLISLRTRIHRSSIDMCVARCSGIAREAVNCGLALDGYAVAAFCRLTLSRSSFSTESTT